MELSVRIMMATYNGEKYLPQQLDSIITQTYENWSIIVQDDGSTDSTWSILEEYAKQDSRITIKKSPEEKHGAYYNFHSIANQEKQSGILYDYYMFCDQDDIWDENKIERMLKRIEKENNGKPIFCYADMRVIDEHSIEKIPSICTAQGLQFINKKSLFFSHIIYGCNTLMNRAAFFSVPIIDTTQEWVGIMSHDNLYAKFSGVLGSVIFYPGKTMGYRRHGGNVTSKHTYGFGAARVLKRISDIGSLARDHAHTYNQSLIMIKMFLANYNEAESINRIDKVLRNGGVGALRYFKYEHISWGNRIKDDSHKLIFLLGLYKKYINY